MMDFKFNDAVEKWDIYEICLNGPDSGNPFLEYNLQGHFKGKCESIVVDGFYDGNGRYKIRFMPSFEGKYAFEVKGNFIETVLKGEFYVAPPSKENHGPVRVANECHFAYDDGTPYYSIGTTCYVWNLQSDERIAETIETLKNSAFNKIRFCVFPKHYVYNLGEPRSYPYVGSPMDSSVLTKENFNDYNFRREGNNFDYERFNPEHFSHIEKCIAILRDLNIEADLILLHPYDRWGFSMMTEKQDDLYIKYCVARFASYRNIWWSLANEYDLIPHKSISDWERIAGIICEKDPYNHLRSIHNCRPFYDHSRPWITHCSIQRQDLYKHVEYTDEWRSKWRKPIVLDEISYEGDIQHGWGNINGQELVRRFWESAVRGGYPGHGETFFHPEDVLWWSHGGKLHGESHKRFGFLLKIMKETPGFGLRQLSLNWDDVCGTADDVNAFIKPIKDYYLFYFSFMCPTFREYHFDDDTKFQVNVIDTWNMTVEDKGVHQGKFNIDLGGRQYMAVQMKKVKE
ncbi:MAG: DUF5605 domain-containing protein [Lachnospiraceae bacterium]|nr:DUF5605 domain-containing protein [Lachnospiraceae bacterium]